MISPPVMAMCSAEANFGPIVSATLANSGADWTGGNQMLVGGGFSDDAILEVDTIDPPEVTMAITGAAAGHGDPITLVVQGAKTFTIGTDRTDSLVAGLPIQVLTSTGNDGTYTVDSFLVDTGITTVTVLEAIPDATGDGILVTGGQVTVADDHTADFPPASKIFIDGSIGNDGLLPVALSSFAAGATRIFITPEANLGDDSVAGDAHTVGAIVTAHIVDPGTLYATTNNVATTPIGLAFGTGATFDIVI